LIEDWLPAAAIGVECMRERGSASALAPHTYLHIWWARRPLCAARAAVLGSLLPADFPRETFERLLGFGRPSAEIVAVRRLMDTGYRVPGGFGYDRAFKSPWRERDMNDAHAAARILWGEDISVIDPMAGGGSIPLEAARMGFRSLANEYNPVACTVLEATVEYPFRFGLRLAERARHWGHVWGERIEKRLAEFYPKNRSGSVHAYIFARTVPCPDTQHMTPLVPDWHLLKAKTGVPVVAEPIVDARKGTWRVQIREIGREAGRLATTPRSTYSDGKGISLFTNHQIPADYIKAKAQAGEMKSVLYAVAVKTPQGLRFQPPSQADIAALEAAKQELDRLRPRWEKANVMPTELYPEISSDERPRLYGMPRWADMFSPRQLLCQATLVEELRRLRVDIVKKETAELGEAVVHLLAFVIDKFGNHNCTAARFENTRGVIKGRMDRHDFAFKPTYAEMAPCGSGAGLEWGIDNVSEAYEGLRTYPYIIYNAFPSRL
jgi:adenine-specific DNA methylase